VDPLSAFSEVWLVDTEFRSLPGERPEPVCVCARELRTRQEFQQWEGEFAAVPPYSVGPDSLLVAYFASAEIGVHLALNWPKPVRVLDLYTEFRNLTNGCQLTAGRSLLGALAHFGLDAIGAVEKTEMRNLVMRGGRWTQEERTAILKYCWEDVEALERLFVSLLPVIDMPRALYRGRYMAAVASMERLGVPLNAERLSRIKEGWGSMQRELVASIDSAYGVFDGTTFKTDRFRKYLCAQNISWPVLESGELNLSDVTFRDRARAYPALEPLRGLRHALSDLRLNDLAVGKDGFNRCLLSPFSSKTSRNQPSNSRFIFGPSAWLRFLITPPPGYGVVILDWEQQEFGVAAGLSLDANMIDAYRSGDGYLGFAKQACAVPPDATKRTHGAIRDQYKTCSLGTQYGMQEETLSFRIDQHVLFARRLLRQHREIYSQYWRWSDNVQDYSAYHGYLQTVFGWVYQTPPDWNPRTSRNFPMQANGAEMLRLACCLGTEAGLLLCAPVHDAVVVMAPLEQLDRDVATMRGFMEESSRVVLLGSGLTLRTEAKIVRYPDHYTSDRGRVMWDTVMGLLS
jgi:DNA polymerase I